MKKGIGYLAIAILTVTVAIFLGQHSVEFFMSTFSEENQSMGFLGYMLTGGGFFLWLIIFLWMSPKQHERVVSLSMMIICLVGELATAIFNMYTKTMLDAGFAMTEGDIKTMYMLVGVLAVAHAISLIIKFAGQQIYQAFQDDDKDGIPNAFDRHDNRHDRNRQQQQNRPQQPRREFAEDEANVSNLAKNTANSERGAEKGDNTHRPTNGQ